ncbi:hypothetical protein FD04_GL001953 [Secundilactobacillus odoratitofui DSM 19909 = JCM 15043]|uniref:Uncharacterized protein n=1 Tax=Secundilactobacillus odoratitofui DSM 19909 = JCM 15043 TaxID=1423776 RepID=A0A0R1LML3_9LACO|nr:hypothetical protein FD04_GL001953 [Secundilactobacillus odoratitofui DSM 19909 = JCM 15043]
MIDLFETTITVYHLVEMMSTPFFNLMNSYSGLAVLLTNRKNYITRFYLKKLAFFQINFN